MTTVSDHERRTYERVTKELERGGGEHILECRARTAKPGAQCSDSCAVYRCVHRSIKAKLEELDKCNAGD